MAGTCPKCRKHALEYGPKEKAYKCYARGCNWLDREGRTLKKITMGGQMNEWELTDEEIIDAIEAHWVECRNVGVLDMAGADRAIATAAAKKFAEYIDSHNQAPLVGGKPHFIQENDLLLYFQWWQSILKAAVERK